MQPVPRTCPSCRTALGPIDRFCTACGASALGGASAGSPVVNVHVAAPAARKSRAGMILGIIGGIVGILVLAFIALAFAVGPDDEVPAADDAVSFAVLDSALANELDAVTAEPLGARGELASDAEFIHAAVLVDAPDGATITIAWYYEKALQGEVVVPVEPGTRWVTAYMKREVDSTWPLGHYYTRVFHEDDNVAEMHANVTATGTTTDSTTETGGGVRTSWDAFYKEDTDEWLVRVLVENRGSAPVIGINVAAWVNATGEGIAQESRGLVVPAGKTTLYLVPMFHPVNDPEDYVSIALHVTGPAGFDGIRDEVAGAYHSTSTGESFPGKTLDVPEGARVSLLEGSGAFVKWTAEYDATEDSWSFTVRIRSYESQSLDGVAVNARVASPTGNAADSQVVDVDAVSERIVYLNVPSPVAVGEYVDLHVDVSGPEPIGAWSDERTGAWYSEYNQETYGGA